MLDANGEPVRIPGMLKHVKAIGWYVEEYGIAQVSMNLTNIEETPLHAAFRCLQRIRQQTRLAGNRLRNRGNGSEEMSASMPAAIFLRKQKWSEGAAEEELIEMAVRSMGLSELKPFDPREKVIEMKIESGSPKRNRCCNWISASSAMKRCVILPRRAADR